MSLDDLHGLALRLVFADLPSTVKQQVIAGVERDEEGTPWYRFSERGQVALHTRRLNERSTVDEATVEIADVLQDDILDSSRGLVWPACPEHPHPAEASLVNGRASWVCPRDGHPVATIGSLAPSD